MDIPAQPSPDPYARGFADGAAVRVALDTARRELPPELFAYLLLEDAARVLEKLPSGLAEHVRDAMDHVWYALLPEARAVLDARTPQASPSLDPAPR